MPHYEKAYRPTYVRADVTQYVTIILMHAACKDVSKDQLPKALRPEVIETNVVPSPEECDLIRSSLIPFYAGRCSVIDAQIYRTQAHLEALLYERQGYQEDLDAHRAALSPIRRVVPDVLLEIFHHCQSQAADAPMRLKGVCRKWRELVLSTPTLWTMVSLCDIMPAPRLVPFARACATYSRSCSIKVAVTVKSMHRRQTALLLRQAISEALTILVRHFHRWQAFEVCLDRTFTLDKCPTLPEHGPLLEVLVLRTEHSASLPFSSLPSLRDITLFTTLTEPQSLTFLLRSTQLRNLSIGGQTSLLTLEDCWTILSNCVEIETFHVTTVSLDTSLVVEPKGEITLPRLREFRIGPSTPDPTSLINCIKTPTLQRLQLCLDTRRDFDSSCVQRLVQECRPPLTTLYLTNMDGAIVAALLPLLPHLASLSLTHPNSPDHVMNRLTEQDAAGQFVCPMLVYFMLSMCSFAGEQLVRLARERRRAAGGLRVLLDGLGQDKARKDVGLTIKLSMVDPFTGKELEELHDLVT